MLLIPGSRSPLNGPLGSPCRSVVAYSPFLGCSAVDAIEWQVTWSEVAELGFRHLSFEDEERPVRTLPPWPYLSRTIFLMAVNSPALSR